MNVLIVEDQFSLADAMRDALEKEGFPARVVKDGESGEYEALTGIYDLVILDVMLPRKSGFEVLKKVKEETELPVIMVTAKGELEDRLSGLDNGADDYITKPFYMKELVARVNSVLRRANHTKQTNRVVFGDISLDVRNSVITCGDRQLQITGKAFRLLEVLARQSGNVLTREQLLVKIWGYDCDTEYNNVEVYVSFLRKKLKLLQSNVKVTVVRNVGYKLEEGKC